MRDKISVIVPVYNVARYLPECVESLINQSYSNLEIILIDDGSSDDSGKICDDYAKKDERVIVIHQKNGGAASARNAGLEIATGYYLSFIDSDDYLERDTYARMLRVVNKYDADVVQFAFREVYQNDTKNFLVMETEREFDTEEYLKRYITDWTCGMACDKLFRRELFEGIFYETGHRIDDEFFTYQGIMNAKKIVYTPEVAYNYRMRASSVMNNEQAREEMLFDRLEYLTIRRQKIVKRFPTLKKSFNLAYLDSLIYLSMDEYITIPVLSEIQRLIKAYLRKAFFYVPNLQTCINVIKILVNRPAELMKFRKQASKSNDKTLFWE